MRALLLLGDLCMRGQGRTWEDIGECLPTRLTPLLVKSTDSFATTRTPTTGTFFSSPQIEPMLGNFVPGRGGVPAFESESRQLPRELFGESTTQKSEGIQRGRS